MLRGWGRGRVHETVSVAMGDHSRTCSWVPNDDNSAFLAHAPVGESAKDVQDTMVGRKLMSLSRLVE